MHVLNQIAAFVTQFVTPIYVLRAPLIAAITAFLFLSVPDQTLEIYRALALDRGKFAPQITMSVLTLVLASVAIWYLGRLLTLRWQQEQLSVHSVTGGLLRWMPRFIGALPLFGAAVGTVTAARRFSALTVPDNAQLQGTLDVIKAAGVEFTAAKSILYWAGGAYVGLGLLLILLTFLRSYGKHWKYEQPSPMLFGPYTRILFYVVTFGLVIAFSAMFVGDARTYGALATTLGAFTIFNLFVLCFAFFLSVLCNIYDRTHFPALSLLIVVATLSTAVRPQ
jgi:hypothetical protein